MKISLKIASLIAILAFAITAQPAQAEPENPIVRGSLSVETIGSGKVTGTGIDCGNDCSDSATWRDNEMPPKNRLTATANPGWGFHGWSNCAAVTNQPNRCDATYSEDDTNIVTARFVDVQPPNVYISFASPGDRAGDSLLVGAETADNDRVTRVEFLINGQVLASDNEAPWVAELDTSAIDEGNVPLQARAFDAAGNSWTTADWPMEIDHTAPELSLNSPVAATNANSPQFSFTSPAADFLHGECAIQKKGETDELTYCGPDEWYSEATPTEGVWEFVVLANDLVGNKTTVKHEFVVDRTAPEAAFTAGPADGSVVEVGNVTYQWNATDDLPLTQICSWDNGEATPCNGKASRGLTAGVHTFKAIIGDQAGNSTTLSRTVNVKKDGTTRPPDPNDKTAPAIRLAAPKQTLKSARKALKLNVRCDEACSGQVVVKGKGGIRFTGRVSLARTGTAKLKLRPTAKVRKRLVKLGLRSLRPRPLKLTSTASLKDIAGNTGKATLKFKVKA